jgi:hypothetical protein
MKFADKEKQIFPKVYRSHQSLQLSIQLFENFLDDSEASVPGDYYRARKLLKEGDTALQEALMNAKKLLGPMPEYATAEYKQWREEFLEKYQILAKCSELKECQSELSSDEFLSQLMPPEEVDAMLKLHFHSQQEGKRKLENIKVRIVLDKLHQMLTHAKELQKQALIKQQYS